MAGMLSRSNPPTNTVIRAGVAMSRPNWAGSALARNGPMWRPDLELPDLEGSEGGSPGSGLKSRSRFACVLKWAPGRGFGRKVVYYLRHVCFQDADLRCPESVWPGRAGHGRPRKRWCPGRPPNRPLERRQQNPGSSPRSRVDAVRALSADADVGGPHRGAGGFCGHELAMEERRRQLAGQLARARTPGLGVPGAVGDVRGGGERCEGSSGSSMARVGMPAAGGLGHIAT